MFIIALLVVGIVTYFYCNSDSRIINLLNSNTDDNIINGATKAGKKGDRKFIALLLKNAADERMSTHLFFKGVTVYQAKMEALQKIFKVSPPVEITYKADSAIIKFYTELYKRESK